MNSYLLCFCPPDSQVIWGWLRGLPASEAELQHRTSEQGYSRAW